MKTACQHLLRRRDLSCTKVNAVNRLSNCLYASFRLSKKRLLFGNDCPAPLGKAGLSPVGSRQPALAAQLGHNKQTQLFKPVRMWGRKPSQLKKGATEPLSGSAIFPCCISVLLYHIHPRQLVWKKIASPHSRIINLLRTHGGQP